MKRTSMVIAMSFVLLGLILSGCDLSFSPTSPSSGDIETAREGLNQPDVAGALNAGDITFDATGFDASATVAQTIDVEFAGAHIDEDSISGIKIYTLSATAATDGAYSRVAELTPASSEVFILGPDSTARFTIDVVANTNISNPLEIEIDATVVTFDDGTRQLDLDGDGDAGEAEDSEYQYATVGTPDVTAAGAQRDPQAGISITAGGIAGAAIGNTSYTLTWSTDKLTAAILNAAYNLYKYNATTGEWDAVSVTGAFNATTSVYTVTLPAAIAEDEVYREELSNPYDIQETSTTNGFARRYSYDQDETVDVYDASQAFQGASSSFYAGGSAALFEAVNGVTVTYDGANNNGFVTLDFDNTVIGNEGVDSASITADTLKLYDSTDNRYVEWESKVVSTDTINQTTYKNDVVVLYLNPGFEGGSGNTLQLHIGPTVKVLGDTTATTDDEFIGLVGNVVTTYPFGQFRVYAPGATF